MHLENIIKKFDIKIDVDCEMPNGERHRFNAQQDDQSYLSYKDRKFFDRETVLKKKNQQDKIFCLQLIDLITMKEELHLLASLIQKNFEPIIIQDLIAHMRYIPVDWVQDLGIFSDIELPAKEKKPVEHDVVSKESEETEEKQKRRYQFDVAYIFEKVETRVQLGKIIKSVTDEIESQLRLT